MTAWNKYNIEVNDWDSLMKIKFNENIETEGRYCDVGACNGVITSFFKSLAGDKGMVYAFETIKLQNFLLAKLLSICLGFCKS